MSSYFFAVAKVSDSSGGRAFYPIFFFLPSPVLLSVWSLQSFPALYQRWSFDKIEVVYRPFTYQPSELVV